MILFSVKDDLDKITRNLDPMTSRQMPFAVARALTATAKEIQADTRKEVPKVFSRPTAFTRNAFAIKAARKTDLTAIVFAKDIQARYLAPGIQGSARRVKGFERKAQGLAGEGQGRTLVPTRNVKLDASGNVSLATIKRIAGAKNSKRYFVGSPKGGRPFGIYERKAGGLQALFVEANVGQYDKRLDLEGLAAFRVRSSFMRNLHASMQQAMATARR